jgi:hypothetical protein
MATAEAGSNQIICANTNLTVAGASATNYSTLLWTSNGTGSFTGATSLTPTYIPSAGDTAAGSIRLYLTAYGNSPCGNAMDSIDLDIIPEPVIFAGADKSVCANSTVSVNDATAYNVGSITWASSGTGSFLNGSSINTTYIPSAADTAAGTVDLYMNVTGLSSCASIADTLTVTILPEPFADAGSDQTICANSTLTINGAVARNYNTIGWRTSGSGSFSNASNLSTVYSPSNADTAAGTVTIYLDASGNGSCASVSDSFTLTITPEPFVFAGDDIDICASSQVAISTASARNYASITWTSSGTGTFDNASIISPTYTASNADTAAGSVTLYLTATGNSTCASVIDSMNINFVPVPVADAGSNQTICANSTYTVSGASARNYGTINWTTSGSGSFASSNTLTPTYSPSNADTAAGSVTLYLSVSGNSTCSSVSDSFVLTFVPEPTVFAGTDTAICTQGIHTEYNATATNYSSLIWSTSGTGSLVNGTTLMPTYIPSSTDVSIGTVTLTITANGNSPCSAVSDNVIITINPKPSTPVIKHN